MKSKFLQWILVFMAFAVKGRANEVSWEYNPYAYQYDMTVYIDLSTVDDATVTDNSTYQIGAFCNGECRGIAERKSYSGHEYLYLRVRSNMASEETITFYVKNLTDDKVATATETIGFSSQQTVGLPSSPLLINARNEYNIKFVIDGEEYTSTLYYGDDIETPKSPTKTGYTFSGWDNEIPTAMPAENLTFNALWAINSYKLTYKVDGEVYKEYDVEYNSPVTPETAPEKDGYTFSGWSEVPTNMPANDTEVLGTFSNIKQFKVTFVSDGVNIKEETLDFGSEISAPENPVKIGYTFTGWSPAVDATVPLHDVIYTAQFIVNKYTITFNTNDGSPVAPITLDYGSEVVAPANPTKTGYVFVSWDKAIPATMPAEDVTANAIWGEVIALTDGTRYENGADKEHAYVTYSRTFNNTNLQPLYVPFAMQYDDWKNDFYIYEFVGFKQDVTKSDFTSQIREVRTATTPNNIYLIQAKAKGAHQLTAYNTTLKAAQAEDSNPLHFEVNGINFDFYGTYLGKDADFLYDDGSHRYWCMAGGTLYFPEVGNTNSLNPYRWYLSITDAAGHAAKVRIRMAIDTDDATDIEEIGESAPQAAQAGKYIENGKVIIVKGGRKYDLNGVEMKSE